MPKMNKNINIAEAEKLMSRQNFKIYTFMKSLKHLFCLLALSVAFISCEEEPAPLASFTFVGANKSAPAEVTFTNNSQNATSYLWEFGDGASSTEKNTKHTYTT
ncbi:PKD domain-containing protein, partial [bacterium]|nr:PKD domain-containing protein [bacterium]